MITIRERLERLIRRNACIFSDEEQRACKESGSACDWCENRWSLEAILRDLDDCETAWRNNGETYRVVPDKIEVNS